MAEMGTPVAPQPVRRNWIPVLIALVVLVGGAWVAKAFLAPTSAKTVLFMGVDEGKTRTDVVVLAHVDPKQNVVNLLSIPRDTLVDISCSGLKECVSPDKLAHAHVYGGDRGPALTVKAVEKLLGIKINHYVRFDYQGFEKAVDALGGVDIVIDTNMDYEDPAARPPLRIHFKASPNPQHLNGAQALNFVRFRADGRGDIGRIERTKKFFFALAKTAKQNGSVTKLPSVVGAVLPYLTTDIDTASAIALARLAPKIPIENIHEETLPGTDKILDDGRWVWIPDKSKINETVDRLIRNPKPPVSSGK